ncbi:FtsK/SpoIIIE domain-containing protein [uncultured Oscillibacter sp.]|uniref:FtsK/SpoIIIE domain-containing protein n=1 Tax=uncultured Oscillibacter sp. TaxID=876091 RepID=UPI002622B525|nr:FtsK/SpoIIIE domain-containing protein [uncultured Oscillibacter sp.]
MDGILWHEDFRRCLLTYHENEETGPAWDEVIYTSADRELYLCPEADDLLYRKTAQQERIVDYSDDHPKSRDIFRQLIQEADLPPVKWQGGPYYWRHKSINGLNLRPGQLDGRPDRPAAVTLGDDAVHGLIVGRTGSGKSVLLNNLLVTLMDEYAPWELSLYMVDMKKVEFGAFMSKGQEAAHVKACAATGEVRYIISMLETLERVMQMRQNFFTAIGCKKLSDFRRENPTLLLPRVLVVVDEFQQLFLNAAGRERDDILRLISSITRLGRATGFHLLFASQEMTGTGVGGLLGNFKLRMALPCDAPVSSEILGNSAAAELDKGWVLVNSAGGDESRNQRFRVPFVDQVKTGRESAAALEDQYLQGHLTFVRQMARQSGFLRAQTQKYYQEDLQFDISLFENRVLPKIRPAREGKTRERGKYLDAFALGSTVLYSTARVDLENICVERGRGQNIMVIAPDPGDLVYLQKLMADNLASSPRLHQPGGLELDYVSFDPVLASYYPIQSDPFLLAAGLKPRMLDEAGLPGLIRELLVRKVLFRYLSGPLLPAEVCFERASLELLQSLENCQARERDRQIALYDVSGLRVLRDNLLKELKNLPEEDLEGFIARRKAGPEDLPPASGQPGFSAPVSPGLAARSAIPNFRRPAAAPETPASPPPPPPPDPALLARVQEGLELFLTLLRHYAACRAGTPIQDQLPLWAVMMSNTTMSDLLSAASPRRDIRVFQEELIPQATACQTLFLYFTSEAGNPLLRGGFNYFFVCGNREKDYTYCRMRYTNKAPGSIVVDCRIHSKNVERSFKKFRWLPAQPSADALDLSGVQDLYEEDGKGEEEIREMELPPPETAERSPAPRLRKTESPQKSALDFF